MCVCIQKQYRSDLNWMKGVGWEASKSLDVQQAKKAGALVSEVTYDPECIAEISCRLRDKTAGNIKLKKREMSALIWSNSNPQQQCFHP